MAPIGLARGRSSFSQRHPSPHVDSVLFLTTIAIREKDSSVVITTRKPSAIHTVKKSQHSSTIRPRSGSRRVSGIVSRYASKDYRPDLRKFALARASAVLASTKEPKPEHEKKTRGKKALKA
ncbi:hypothetical protein EXIGLDRAFT_838426 [Exidia glandulosa HHB12029]|uniref:Ribosomal eL28/Mak16 domain-containing protein n=1 Tax=Exidia glandulosa HHB12029 TaxID=1314781 RepID=A0A165FVB1_EXIGL|nr:hypothetical protein EXIGLDRAFT_838426 [Exidia glandulosa HHB12029]